MIRSVPVAKALAFGVAIAAHGALALVLVPDAEAPMIDSAGGTADVRLGSAFADMAAGTLTAHSASELTEAAQEHEPPPDVTTPSRPETHAGPLPASRTEWAQPATPPLDPVTPATPPLALAALSAEAALPVRAQTVQPAESAPRAEPLPATPQASPAVTRSMRPKPRSAEFVAAHAPEPKKAQPARAATTGNAEKNARAGATTGRQAATATKSGGNGTSQAAGNAAASTYPGLVMRQLSRAGKPRARARGTALVAFRIAGSGALSSVSLARSSGSETLDRAAVQLVRNAAPFPKPPQGAQRSFSIQIKGR